MARIAKIKGTIVAKSVDGPVTWFVSRHEGAVTVTPAFSGRILNSEAISLPDSVVELLGATVPTEALKGEN